MENCIQLIVKTWNNIRRSVYNKVTTKNNDSICNVVHDMQPENAI